MGELAGDSSPSKKLLRFDLKALEVENIFLVNPKLGPSTL
jgi:hypothetical protein